MTPALETDEQPGLDPAEHPHRPTPLETLREDGSLHAETETHINDRCAIVEPDDVPLYRLVMDVLHRAEAHVPDLMPAHLATHCDDLVDARETVTNVERGSIILGGDGPSYGMSYCYATRDAIDAHRDRDPLRLVAVGCSGSKHDVDGAVPAKDLYKGACWTCKRSYGETIATDDEWRVISAAHAVLHPDQEIESYERTPEDLEDIPVDSDQRLPSGDPVDTLLDEWALRVYHELAAWIDTAAGGLDPRDVELEVLLGRSYRDPLEARGVFDALRAPAGLGVSFPFQEEEQAQGGNGNQMGWMTDRVDEAAQEVDA